MKKVLVVLLAVAMVFTLSACGKKKDGKVFTMGIDAEYPPFSYIDENGEYGGFDVDVCKACCDILGYEFKVFGVNWDEKLVQLDAKECDCVWSGMTILQSMKDAGYVISDPYFYNSQVLLVKDSSGIKSSDDLAGKVISVMLGTSGDTLLEEDLAYIAEACKDVVRCESFLKCFTELDGGAVDAVLVDLPVAKSYVSDKDGFTIINEDLGAEEYGVAFRNGDQALCDKFEEAIEKLVKSGEYEKIAAKYEDIDTTNLIYLNK